MSTLAHDPSTNNPPSPVGPSAPQPIAVEADLAARYPTISARLAEHEAAAATVPEQIEDDAVAGTVGAMLKTMRVDRTGWDTTRKAENEEWKTVVGVVNNFFKKPIDRLEALESSIKARLTRYLDEKAEKKRLADEAAAKKLREEAARAAAAAAELAERKRAAEEAERDAAEAAREASQNQDEDEQRVLDLRAALALAKATKAVARRDKNDDAMATAEADMARLQGELDTAKKELTEKRRLAREAQNAADLANRNRRKAEEHVARGDAAAERHEKTAATAERRATNTSEAERSQTRGDHGTVTSLAGRWTVIDVEMATVDLESLRIYLHPDAVRAACQKFMMANLLSDGGPKLKGALFERVSDARVAGS